MKLIPTIIFQHKQQLWSLCYKWPPTWWDWTICHSIGGGGNGAGNQGGSEIHGSSGPSHSINPLISGMVWECMGTPAKMKCMGTLAKRPVPLPRPQKDGISEEVQNLVRNITLLSLLHQFGRYPRAFRLCSLPIRALFAPPMIEFFRRTNKLKIIQHRKKCESSYLYQVLEKTWTTWVSCCKLDWLGNIRSTRGCLNTRRVLVTCGPQSTILFAPFLNFLSESLWSKQ